MPLLSYSAITDYPFQPFTKIYSADVNAMFAAIQALLNTTKIDYQNVQALGLKRYGSTGNMQAGTANTAVYNDASGYLAEAATLPPLVGGTGVAVVPASQSPGDVIQINSTSTGFTIGPPTAVPASLRIFTFLNFS